MKRPQAFEPMAQGTIAEWERTQEIVTAVNSGAQYVLSELAEFIPEVKNTSLWKEYDMDNYN